MLRGIAYPPCDSACSSFNGQSERVGFWAGHTWPRPSLRSSFSLAGEPGYPDSLVARLLALGREPELLVGSVKETGGADFARSAGETPFLILLLGTRNSGALDEVSDQLVEFFLGHLVDRFAGAEDLLLG